MRAMLAPSLTQMDLDTLEATRDLNAKDLGIFADGIGEWSHFRKLERHGLLEFYAMGVDNDDHLRFQSEVPLYRLTPEGKAALVAAGKAA